MRNKKCSILWNRGRNICLGSFGWFWF